MSALIDAFTNGGLWMYIIVLWGGAFTGLLVYQYAKRGEKDLTSILWGLLLSLALLGPLGSTVGIYQASLAMAAKEGLAPTEAVQLVSTYVGIASTTTIFSTLLAVIGAVALGFLSHRVRNPGPPARRREVVREAAPAEAAA